MKAKQKNWCWSAAGCKNNLLTLLLVAAFVMTTFAINMETAYAADAKTLDGAVSAAAAYMTKTVKAPIVGSVGGEWAVIGLARSGQSASDSYYEAYYKTVKQYVKDCKGILHDKKYTEYSRIILGLTAAGYDPRNVAGYDLTYALGDFERTIWQGINGPVFALIALDSRNYPVPANKEAKTQATRDLYTAEILRRQLPDGGWNLTAGADGKIAPSEKADADITGMALQALAKYQDRANVKTAIDKALSCLSAMQDEKGGYSSWGDQNSESVVQVLVALCELGVSVNDARFIKNGITLVDNILSYQNTDGSFRHTSSGSGNSQMSSEQVFYGLVAAQRARDGKNSLYRMSDAKQRGAALPTTSIAVPTSNGTGLSGKHADIKAMPVTSPGKTFADIAQHPNKAAVEALAARSIVSGRDNGFEPNATMTRAEYATIVTRGLGLVEKPSSAFKDVTAGAWYAGYVGSAHYYSIVSGAGDGNFNPTGTITRQEAAVMTARAAKLCGMDTAVGSTAIRDMLAQFGDYTTSDDWSRESLAFCYKVGILDESDLNIRPKAAVTRGEIAEMLFRMLDRAKLL